MTKEHCVLSSRCSLQKVNMAEKGFRAAGCLTEHVCGDYWPQYSSIIIPNSLRAGLAWVSLWGRSNRRWTAHIRGHHEYSSASACSLVSRKTGQQVTNTSKNCICILKTTKCCHRTFRSNYSTSLICAKINHFLY